MICSFFLWKRKKDKSVSLFLNGFFVLTDEIHSSFCRFGPLTVDWPHKAESKSYFPPKGTF